MKVAFVGDIAFFGKYCVNNGFDVKTALSELKNVLSKFDFIVANLEAPLTSCNVKTGAKSVYIKSDINNVQVLKYLGVGAVSLANNHIYDFGLKGLEETISVLNKNNIDFYGTDGKSLKIEIKDEKIALHGFCSYITNPSFCSYKDRISKNDGLNLLELKEVISSMEEAGEEGYFNILSAHSGLENVSIPSLDDIAFARELAERFNYLYHGHHPHVIQGLEKHNKSVLAYSQGNCIFDDIYDHRTGNKLVEQSFINSCSFILSVNIIKNNIMNYSTIPFSFHKEKFTLHCHEAKKILEERSLLLNLSDAEKTSLRKSDLKQANISLAERRNLKWFISRLRVSTVFRLLNNKINIYLYKKKYKTLIGGN